MSNDPYKPTQEDIDSTYNKIKKDAESNGYFLNPDVEFAKSLVESLLINEKRYGYWSCPCRLSDGIKEDDIDIICPCDYRDPDLTGYGACFCALYVVEKIAKGLDKAHPVPERRLPLEERKKAKTYPVTEDATSKLSYPVWRCKVCGYLCAREEAPDICPICKVKKDRFERFM